MPNTPDRKYLRSDHTVDQRAFDENHIEVGLGTQDRESIWSEVLSLGKIFQKNIADELLLKSVQPRRGAILVTRLESSQQTRAISFRAAKHEYPKVALSHIDTQAQISRADERRSLTTARHAHHSRAMWTISVEHKDSGTIIRRLAFGGFKTNIGKEYKNKEAVLEVEKKEKAEKARLAQIPTEDDIKF